MTLPTLWMISSGLGDFTVLERVLWVLNGLLLFLSILLVISGLLLLWLLGWGLEVVHEFLDVLDFLWLRVNLFYHSLYSEFV